MHRARLASAVAMTTLAIIAPAALTGAEPKVNLVKVPLAGASCAALDDRHGVLVFGERGAGPAQLAVYRLGEGGAVATQPQRAALPQSAAVASFPHYALSVVFHPRLPLVYAWQDFTGPQAVAHEVDHLVTLSLEGGALKPLAALARGPEYAWTRSVGSIAIDPGGRRLFLPNLRDEQSGLAALGYFDLDDKGLPTAVPVPIGGSLDGFGLEKYEMKVRASRMVVATDASFPTLSGGYVVASPDAALFAAHSGLGVWDTNNRRAALAFVHVPLAGPATLVAAHPKLPMVYGVSTEEGRKIVFRMRHAGGYPTLMPEVLDFAESTGFRSAPVVVWGRTKCLAIGGAKRLYLVGLDGQGEFTGDRTVLELPSGTVSAMAYSAKHDRLYVATEK